MLKVILLAVFVAFAAAQDNPIDEVTVEAGDLGKIVGVKLNTARGQRPFYAFHGIPYALPTDGEGRFKPSILRKGPLTEDGTNFLALDPLIGCPQGGLFRNMKNKENVNILSAIKAGKFAWNQVYEGESKDPEERIGDPEDSCLVININTPKIPRTPEDQEDLKPVIFFVHGGSSTQVWGALFTGFRFLDKEVILVTINYRLGILGALNLGIDEAPGNAAMYDCLTALDWVHEYIHHWGGDKNRITLYGHSAGAMMVSHLMLSPLSAGKFIGVIGSSGNALACWGTAEHPSINHHLIVSYHAGCYDDPLGIPKEDTDYYAIYECMKAASVQTLLSALSSYSRDEQRVGKLGFDAKVPSVQDSSKLTIPVFLPKMPAQILASGEQQPVNLIMGANRHDGSFAFEDIWVKFIKYHGHDQNATYLRNDLLPQLLDSLKATDVSGSLAHAIANTYFGDAAKSGDAWAMMPGLIDLTSVWGFKAPSWELVEKHSKMNPNSYYYAFDHVGYWSTYDMSGNSEIPGGIAHIEDMMYLFQLFPLGPIDGAVSDRMVEYFVNFAYTGNPNPPEGPINFPAYDPIKHSFIKIGPTDTPGENCRDDWIDNALEIM